MRYIAHPEEANSDKHQQKSFADLDLLAKAYNFYAIRLDVKINKYLYNENSPKYPLSVTVTLDYVGKSSKRTIHRIFHQDDLETPYVECILTDVLVSQDTMKPAPYPDWWIEKYAPLCKRDKLPNLVLPTVNEQTHCRTSTVVNLSDTDIYKHTHITSYIKYFYDSVYRNISNNGYKNISQNHFDSGVKSVSLEYTGQSIVHDELDITTWEICNDNVVYGTIEKKGGNECCRIKMEFYNEKVQPML